MATLPPEELAYQQAHRDEDASGSLIAFYAVCIALTFLCAVSRTTSRRLSSLGLQADDWTLLVGATIAEGSFIVLMIYAVNAGLGKHWITLTPDQMKLFSKLNYAYNILNIANYPFIKISIILLYMRIFISPTFRRVAWACIALIACIGISLTLVAVFPCTPIQGFYDLTVPARCVDPVSFYWACALLNGVITDAIILVLPMPVVWKLQMSLRRKIGITLIFLLGGLTFVISIIRIIYYLQFNPNDPSYSFIQTGFATPAEVTLAIICACAATWRPLSRRAFEIARSWSSGHRQSDTTLVDLEKNGRSKSQKSAGSHDTSSPDARLKSSAASHSGARSNATTRVDSHDGSGIGRDSSDELPPMPPSLALGADHGIFEAKKDGLPATRTSAWTEREEGLGEESGGSAQALGLPVQGIRVEREVTVNNGKTDPPQGT